MNLFCCIAAARKGVWITEVLRVNVWVRLNSRQTRKPRRVNWASTDLSATAACHSGHVAVHLGLLAVYVIRYDTRVYLRLESRHQLNLSTRNQKIYKKKILKQTSASAHLFRSKSVKAVQMELERLRNKWFVKQTSFKYGEKNCESVGKRRWTRKESEQDDVELSYSHSLAATASRCATCVILAKFER